MMNTPKVPNGPGGMPNAAKPAAADGRTTAPMPDASSRVASAGADPMPPQPMKPLSEGIAEQAKHAAGALLGQTKEKLETTFASRKDEVTDRTTSVASAIREAGEKLGGEGGGALPSYAGQAADQVDRLTKYVQSRSMGQLVGDVENFARKEPLIVFGSCFALGFIAARFMKSSGHRDNAGATAASSPAAKANQHYTPVVSAHGPPSAAGMRPGVHT